MLTYLISLGAGVLVGVIYGLINVRSPAPPLVALVGLLGILAGEQIIPVGKQLLAGSAFLVASVIPARSAIVRFFDEPRNQVIFGDGSTRSSEPVNTARLRSNSISVNSSPTMKKRRGWS